MPEGEHTQQQQQEEKDLKTLKTEQLKNSC